MRDSMIDYVCTPLSQERDHGALRLITVYLAQWEDVITCSISTPKILWKIPMKDLAMTIMS